MAKEDEGSEGHPGDETARAVWMVRGGSEAPSIPVCWGDPSGRARAAVKGRRNPVRQMPNAILRINHLAKCVCVCVWTSKKRQLNM